MEATTKVWGRRSQFAPSGASKSTLSRAMTKGLVDLGSIMPLRAIAVSELRDKSPASSTPSLLSKADFSKADFANEPLVVEIANSTPGTFGNLPRRASRRIVVRFENGKF